ncbi:hypothetical protein GF352_01480 [archaeon]|nr:hypothetical protein [archaeon]
MLGELDLQLSNYVVKFDALSLDLRLTEVREMPQDELVSLVKSEVEPLLKSNAEALPKFNGDVKSFINDFIKREGFEDLILNITFYEVGVEVKFPDSYKVMIVHYGKLFEGRFLNGVKYFDDFLHMYL